jgi:hypothetical protein
LREIFLPIRLNELKDLHDLIREAKGVLYIENFTLQVNYMPNVVNISGGAVGALNLSGVQIVHSIDMKIGELINKPGSQDFAKALRALTEAIASNTDALTEDQRNMALGQVELLGQQASLPAEQRSKPMVGALVNTLANVCAGAGGLAAAWTTWEPALRAFLGV